MELLNPDGTVDVVTSIKVRAGYQITTRDQHGFHFDMEDLGCSKELMDRILRWEDYFLKNCDPDFEFDSEWFDTEGLEISYHVKKFVGKAVGVEYWELHSNNKYTIDIH